MLTDGYISVKKNQSVKITLHLVGVHGPVGKNISATIYTKWLVWLTYSFKIYAAYLEINVAKAFANASHAISDDSHIFDLAASSKNAPQFIFFDSYGIEIYN